MEYLYKVDNGEVMGHLIKWLTLPDKAMAYMGVLCIGNVARTDRHSMEIVEREIHKLLLNMLRDENLDVKVQYAVLSTIRYVLTVVQDKTLVELKLNNIAFSFFQELDHS